MGSGRPPAPARRTRPPHALARAPPDQSGAPPRAQASLTKEKDERIAKLNNQMKELKASVGGVKDLKATIASKDLEVAGLRKQLGAAQRVEDELRKQQASAASASKAEERQKNDAIAKLKGTIEQTHAVEVRRLGEEHEVALAARSREVAQLTAQLKSTLQKYQRAQSTLADERDRIREVLLGSRSMAEVSMAFTPEQETKLLHKVEQQVHECSADEMHWLVTKPFRTWLAQSYTECDEVCDALEAEQQRLKRIYHTKEQELTRMRAYATCLRSKIRWCYQVRRTPACRTPACRTPACRTPACPTPACPTPACRTPACPTPACRMWRPAVGPRLRA